MSAYTEGAQRARKARLEGIGGRMMAVYGALILSTVIVLLSMIWSNFARHNERESVRLSVSIASAVSAGAERVILSGKHHLKDYFDHYVEETDGVEFIVTYFSDGSMVNSGESVPMSTLSQATMAQGKDELPAPRYSIQDVELMGRPIREITTSFTSGFGGEFAGKLRIGISRENEFASQRLILSRIGLVGAAVSLIALLFLRFASRRMAAPVVEISGEFTGLLEHAPLGVLIQDQDGVVIRASRKAEDVFGADLVERGAVVYELFEPTKADEWEAEGNALIIGELPLIHRERTILVDGEARTFTFIRFALRGMSGGGANLCTIFVDITQNRELEDHLVQSHRMESLGQFAGGVAHDFNNVIAAVLGYSEMLLQDAEPGSRAERYSESIVKSCDRGRDLAARLLAFGRGPQMEQERHDLNQLLGGFELFLRRLLPSDMSFELVLGPPRILPVFVDTAQIERVLMNLVSNARDALGVEGHIVLTTRECEVGEGGTPDDLGLPPGRYAELCVEDDGCGIAPDQLAGIFDPFASTKSGADDTGLGLTISRSIISRHGGAISVDSERGKGTVFTIRLPLVAGSAPLSTEPIVQAEWSGPPDGTRALVVEDDDEVRFFVGQCLRDLGFDVIDVSDGEQGLAAFEEASNNGRTIELVVTDVVMPRLGGIPMIRQLRRRAPQMSFVFMTAYDGNALEELEFPAEEMFVLRKPFMIAQLRERVAAALAWKSATQS
jgi:two-component system, cell cycle sensor histidine kinase and response regulator CckA